HQTHAAAEGRRSGGHRRLDALQLGFPGTIDRPERQSPDDRRRRSGRRHAGVEGVPGERGEGQRAGGADVLVPREAIMSPAVTNNPLAVNPLDRAARANSAPATEGRIRSTLVDITNCIGCRACQVACKEWNEQPGEDTALLPELGFQNPAVLSAKTLTLIS